MKQERKITIVGPAGAAVILLTVGIYVYQTFYEPHANLTIT